MRQASAVLVSLATLIGCGRGGDEPAAPVAFEHVDTGEVAEPVGPPARELLVGRFEHTASAGGVEWTTGVSFDGTRLVRLRDGVPTGVDVCTVRSEDGPRIVLECTDDNGTATRRPWTVDADGAVDLVTNLAYRRTGPALPGPAEGSGS